MALRISNRSATRRFVLCVILAAGCSSVLADRTQGSGGEALPVDDHQSTDASDSGDSESVTHPFPLFLLLLIVSFVSLLVVVCSCVAFVCCIFCYCRNFRHSNESAAHTYHPSSDCEQGLQFGNPTYKETDLESEANSTHPSDSLQNIPHRHQYARSSQSIVTYATPRIAVNRPSFSETNLTLPNRLALQLAFQVQLQPPDAFEFCNETRSLPRMPPSRHDQVQLPPNWLANTASAEGLSQAVVSSHVEPTATTQTNEEHSEETEV